MKLRWDEYEVALLIDTYVRTIDMNIFEKTEVIKKLSDYLRQRAIGNGIKIDDVFRNVIGITMRLSNIEYLFTRGKKGLSAYSRLDKELYELYNKNTDVFKAILESSKTKMEKYNTQGKSQKELFFSWLSKEIPAGRIADVSLCLSDIEKFCLKNHVIQKSFFDITSISEVSKVRNAIEGDWHFKLMYKGRLTILHGAIHSYIRFLRETEANVDGKKSKQEEKNDNMKFNEKNKSSNISEDSDNKHTEIYARTFIDKYYQEKYPLIYNKIYSELYRCTNQSRFSVTILQIYNSIGKIGQIEDVKKILDSVSWVKRYITKSGEFYLFDNNKKEIHKETIVQQSQHYKKDDSSVSFESSITSKNSSILNMQNNFIEWMKRDLHIAEVSARNYSSFVKKSGEQAILLGISNITFFEMRETNQIEEVVNALLENPKFVLQGHRQHNKYSEGLNKYLEFARGVTSASSISSINEDEEIKTDEMNELYSDLLAEKFARGFRLNSPLEVKRFRIFYEDKYGEKVTKTDVGIQNIISQIGIEYKDRVFSPRNILNEETKNKVYDYISHAFQTGKRNIYYDALYTEFAMDFEHFTVYTPEMLKRLLAYYNNGQYMLQRSYLTEISNIQVEPIDEIRQCMKTHGFVMSFDEIEEAIPHIPIAKVKQVLAMNAEFISAGRGQYIHIDCVCLNKDDIKKINDIIQSGINDKEFISGNELTDTVKKMFPEIFDINNEISALGLRNAISYHLSDQFSFNGNIISKKDEDLSMSNVFSNYCKNRDTVTLDELNVLKNELGAVIYFDSVYTNKLRISENMFIDNDKVQFDVELVDGSIDRFCTGDYLPIDAIKQFSLFPGVEYPWNSYLLESYVFAYSAKYRLLHTSFNANTSVGAIVRKTSEFQEYEQVLTDALARSTTNLNAKEALDFLCCKGFLGRRHLSNIEQILANAKILREQKG